MIRQQIAGQHLRFFWPSVAILFPFFTETAWHEVGDHEGAAQRAIRLWIASKTRNKPPLRAAQLDNATRH
ncbi:unnamed protein product [Leptidea sinapis]|uniref:Uncharacterized protein n=1 Tax=Leptidea sinapis TaxID=189913 RepID=A0A5E4PS00_9NEOP|nr:unnamed protein product [Leptidea sinapis]